MLSQNECIDKLKRIRELRDAKRDYNDEIKKINEELDELNKETVEYFDAHDLQNMKLDKIGMFYIQRSVFPSIDDRESCENWLREKDDLDMLMSFNSNKFRAYYKEKLENNEELPTGTSEFIKSEVRMRR